MISNKVALKIVFIVGISMFILSIFVIKHSLTILITYEKVQGFLVDYELSYDKNDEGVERTKYTPIYSYSDLQGNLHRVSSQSKSIKKHNSDSTITVYFDRNNPEVATASNFEIFWVPFIAIFFTVMCFWLAYPFRRI